MRKYILVNLIGAMNDKVTLFLETENYKEIEEMVIAAGYGDYKILPDWCIIKCKFIGK